MRKLIGLIVSLGILAAIYWQIDTSSLVDTMAGSDAGWMAAAIGMVVPLTAITAWRLVRLMPEGTSLPLAESIRLVLMASVLNMVLPSKLGDIAKAYAMTERGHLAGPFAVSLVVFEKAWDMLALLVWCVFGLFFLSSRGWIFWGLLLLVGGMLALGLLLVGSSAFAVWFFRLAGRFAPKRIAAKLADLESAWTATLAYFWRDRPKATGLIAISVGLWFLHLLQIWMFILALNAFVPVVENMALAALSILVGLLPFTFAGVGTRDAALILFYAPYLAAPTAAALGLLCTLRYLLPALAGLPFLGRYLATARKAKRELRAET